MNRLGIFQMYDKDGIVDGYIKYLLEDMLQNLSRLIIVCNGEMTEQGIADLRQYTNEIYVRDNSGFDAAAYKEILLKHIFTEKIKEYDELVLFNSTFYGPFYPFKLVFHEMKEKKADFWGLTQHAESISIEWGIVPWHIQSYFLVIREPMLHSSEFIDFWNSLDDDKIVVFKDSVFKFEVAFSQYFSKLGYCGIAYIDASEMDSNIKENNFSHYAHATYDLIKKFHYPIIKRKNFSYKEVVLYGGEDLPRAFNYIDKNTGYDIDLIWENILRNYNIVDIKESLNLNYVLPKSERIHSKNQLNKKVAVFAHITYIQMIDECFEYLVNMPEDFDLFITTDIIQTKKIIQKKIKQLQINKAEIILVKNQVREVSTLIITSGQKMLEYDYACFIHAQKTSRDTEPVTIEKSFNYNIWENTLGSKEYILNILDTFDINPRLGFLSPPPPLHAEYICLKGNEWADCYDSTKRLAHQLDLSSDICEDKMPFALMTAFWCRPQALKKLFEAGLTYDDFSEKSMDIDGELNHAIERIFIYVAQDAGYYSGIVENNMYAAHDISNMNYILSKVIHEANCSYPFYNLFSLLDGIGNNQLMDFVNRYKKLYIYGAGVKGTRIANALNKHGIVFEAFIVSDGQEKQDKHMDHPVFFLSELDVLKQNHGIIIALGKNYVSQVIPLLNEHNIKNYYIYGR